MKNYCTGLLLPGERKSVEPMAARIAEVIRREFGVSYPRDHIGRLTHSLNWSHQKPEKRAVERDAERLAAPVHRHCYRRDKISVISGVSASSKRQRFGLFYQLYFNDIGQEEMCVFLRDLLRHLRGPVIAILDRSQTHHGEPLAELQRRHSPSKRIAAVRKVAVDAAAGIARVKCSAQSSGAGRRHEREGRHAPNDGIKLSIVA